jgi:hypothetical protein
MSNAHVAIAHAGVILTTTFQNGVKNDSLVCASCHKMGEQVNPRFICIIWLYTVFAIVCIQWPKGISKLTLNLCKCYAFILLYWAVSDKLLQYCIAIHGAVHLVARAESLIYFFNPFIICVGLLVLNNGPSVSVVKWTQEHEENCGRVAHMTGFFVVWTVFEVWSWCERMLLEMTQ